MPLLALVLLAAGPSDDELARALFPMPDAGFKVTAITQTSTDAGLVVVAGATSADLAFIGTATVALLDPDTLKVKSRASVTQDNRKIGPWTGVSLGTAAGGLFPVEVGYGSDGMGSRYEHAWFAVLGGRVVKVLELRSEPRPPSGSGGKSEQLAVTRLTSSSNGLPDLAEVRSVTYERAGAKTKRSLVRQLWRFDGARYRAKDIGEPKIAFADGDLIWEPVKLLPVHAVDGVRETAWAADHSDTSLSLTLKSKQPVRAVKILAGCELPDAAWATNPRLKKVRVRLDGDEEGVELDLADVTTEQRLALPAAKSASKIDVDVLEIYPGSNDRIGACISELRLD